MRGATTGIVFDPTDRRDAGPGHRRLRVGIVTFLVAAVAFFVGSTVFVVWGGTPPSATPIASILGHTGWFIAVAFLAIGAVALFSGIEPLGTGLAGYVAVGTLALGVLTGAQWAVLAWIDVLAAGHENYELLLDALISPVGSGLSLLYALFVGSGVAALGWGTRRSERTTRVVDWSGVALGVVAIVATGAVLLSAGKNAIFAATVLLHPLFYLWAIFFALDLYR